MIDYHSTDRSAKIIKEICPTWDVVTSRNADFNPSPIDTEIIDYERNLIGWRIALTVTEFLYGNYTRMEDTTDPRQIFLGQYVMVDMELKSEPKYLDNAITIHQQRRYGYTKINDFGLMSHGSTSRPPRSLHNMPIDYSTGRHFWEATPTYDDLAILYYGYASIAGEGLARKLQIQSQLPNVDTIGSGPGSNHVFTKEQLLDRYRLEQQPLAHDLTEELTQILKFNHALTGEPL